MNAGHNSELSAEERKALFFNHYRPIAAQLEKVKEAQAEYKRLRKLAKADKIGLWEIDYALKCADIEDENIIPDRIRREAEIASWFALPVDYQADMLGDFQREPGEDRARREGIAAGASGIGSNPYDENSALGKAWAGGWSEEQKKARENLQTAMEKKNAQAPENNQDPDFPDQEAA